MNLAAVDSIQVNSVAVRVKAVPREELPDGADGHYTSGRWPTIRYADDLVGHYRDLVILHEWIHACLHVNGVHLHEGDEERICDMLPHEIMRLPE